MNKDKSVRPTTSKISNFHGTEENLNPNIPSTTQSRKDVPVPPTTRTTAVKTLQKPVVSSQRVSRFGRPNGDPKTTNPNPPPSINDQNNDSFVNTLAGMSDALNNISTMIASLQNRLPPSYPSLPQQPLTTNGKDFNTAQCQDDLRQFSDKIHEMVKVNEELSSKYQLEIELLNSKIMLAQNQLSDMESTLGTLRIENNDHRMSIEAKSAELNRIHLEIKTTVHQKTREINSEEERLKEKLNNTIHDYTEKIKSERARLVLKQDMVTQRDQQIQSLNDEIRKNKDTIDSLENRNKQDGVVRRKLHTIIQDLKGNIRVICRIRPLLSGESGDHVTFVVSPNNPQELHVTEMDTTGKRVGSYTFMVDRPLTADATQEEVFQEVSFMVEEAINGHNCCIMAFGQKGSGKTYTMEGPTGILDNTSYGIIPQSASYLFEVIENLKNEWTYQITVSYLKIQNEILCDLLSTESDNQKILEIKQNEKLRKTWVANLTMVRVQNTESVISLLGNVTKTDTSRSHFVFQFQIMGKNLKTQETQEGCLSLISLAGSDRDSGTMTTNDTKKDAIHINSDMLSLNNVFVALVNHEKNVPYRSSKLTHLLQYSLGGKGKASMVATLSPSEQDLKETLNTLRFASKINAYEIKTTKKPKAKH